MLSTLRTLAAKLSEKQFWIDSIHINLPYGGVLAVVKLADVKEGLAILSILFGMVCTYLVTRKKLKEGKGTNEK